LKVECPAQYSTLRIESVFHRIAFHQSQLSVCGSIHFCSSMMHYAVWQRNINSHSKINLLRRMNLLHNISLLELSLKFIVLLSMYHSFSAWRCINFAQMLYDRETCNSHSKTNFLRRLNFLWCSTLGIESLFHMITLHLPQFSVWKTLFLYHNGVLCSMEVNTYHPF
jgi:hypothetical protein